VVYHCTSGSFVDRPEALAARIRERTGLPATTTSLAVLAALNELCARSVILVTPYIDAVNKEEQRFLEAHGVAVLATGGESLQTSAARHHTAPEEIARWVRHADRHGADAIFISCTALRAAECAAALEVDTQRPVVTSNTATLWHMLRLVGIADPVPGCGRLLDGTAGASVPSTAVS
jgi:maleate isomerase